MGETWVQSLGREDTPEKGMATHSSILTWRIPTDRRAWRATVHGVAKSRTRLSDTQCEMVPLVTKHSRGATSLWARIFHIDHLQVKRRGLTFTECTPLATSSGPPNPGWFSSTPPLAPSLSHSFRSASSQYTEVQERSTENKEHSLKEKQNKQKSPAKT